MGGGAGSGRFHPATERYLRAVPADRRKRLGQYFTPREVRERLLDLVPRGAYGRVLDPACGTGEFLCSVRARFPNACVEGWEIDGALAAIARAVAPFARVVQADALAFAAQARGAYDLVVGNPPYFEWNPSREVRERYACVISGRPNIFAFFFVVGLEVLREGGVLAYVVPRSMTNGAYFAALRRYILEAGRIEALEPLPHEDLFPGARQTVLLIVIRKGRAGSRFVFERGGRVIFTPDPDALHRAFEGRVTLAELGFEVRTGSVVWNQHRERLARRPQGAHALLWSHNIGPAGLRFPVDDAARPQYIRLREPLVGPAIVVNRVAGTPGRSSLRAAVVPAGMRFFGENHVNVVLPGRKARGRDLESVARAIRSPEAAAAARLVTGNTQYSAVELAHLLPLRV